MRLKKSLNRPFHYLDRKYDSSFTLSALLVGCCARSDQKEILVSANNYRSPFFLARLAPDGTELGTYWHFGQIAAAYEEDLDGDGKQEIILCGANDSADSIHMESPAIVVLDPSNDQRCDGIVRDAGFWPAAIRGGNILC